MPGFDASDEHLYHIAVPLSSEPEPRFPLSEELYNELLYKVAAQLSF